jgi:DNA primase
MNELLDLKERFDLLAMVEVDLGPGKKKGRWYAWRCPFHDGRRQDDFQVTPDNGRYYCFGCGRSGDVLTWLTDYRRLSWKDIFSLGDSGEPIPARPRSAAPDSKPEGPPAEPWQARGVAFVEACEAALWAPEGAKALDWLQGRGLRDATIKRYRLGYNQADRREPFEAWGLPEDPDSKGVWLPRGVVIPATVAGALWYVKIRRPTGSPKYTQPRGGRPALFNADNLSGAELVLLAEGEFDCILADQELGDVAGVATLGSATNHLDLTTWGGYLLPARAILAAYDVDQAGASGAAALVALSARIHPVRVPALRAGDKDLTDYHQAGGDLWQWLKWQLSQEGILEALGLPYDESPGELVELPAVAAICSQ